MNRAGRGAALRPGTSHVDDEAKAGVPAECRDGARRPLLQIGERALEMKVLIDNFRSPRELQEGLDALYQGRAKLTGAVLAA